MKISVIIPTFNRSEFIVNTINSVLNQTYSVAEIIVIDDGSIDDTAMIIEKLSINTDKIKYISQENRGVSSARNLGILNASNNWICFLDSDDIWNTDKIEQQVIFHTKNPAILFSHTQEQWLFNNKIIKQKKHQSKKSGFCFKENIANTLIGASTVMIHKSILNHIGHFDEELLVCEDYDLWLRILYKYEVGFIDKELIKKIAGHKNQLSFSTPLMDIFRIKVLQKHIKSKYTHEIQDMIVKKCDILIKGAIKHSNNDIESYYKKLRSRIILL